MVSVWVDVESFYKYKKGQLALALSTSNKYANINILIPIEDVVRFYENEKRVEMDIAKWGNR